MEWISHVTPEEREYIDKNHGTPLFKDLVGDALWLGAKNLIKLGIAKESHTNFDMAWKGASGPSNPFHGVSKHVEDKIIEMLRELDDHYRAPAQKGIAWVNSKAHDLESHIETFFVRRR